MLMVLELTIFLKNLLVPQLSIHYCPPLFHCIYVCCVYQFYLFLVTYLVLILYGTTYDDEADLFVASDLI